MPRRKVDLGSFNSVGAGQTATISLPTDRRYHAVFINYKTNANQATIEADITEIRVKVGGKTQRVYSAKELNIINGLNGYSFRAGYIPIFFSEPWRRNQLQEDLLAWGMANINDFQIEVVIDSAAVSPTLGGFAIVDNVEQNLENIIKVRRQGVGVTATGIVTVHTLTKQDIYHRIHCIEAAAGDIKSVDITIDSFDVYKQKDAENDAVLDMRGFVPQASVFHVVFDETQRVEDGLPLIKPNGKAVSEFRLDFDMSTTNDFTMLIETRGNPD